MAYTYKPIGAPSSGEHLAHYGVKGMKWYQSLFTDDLTEAKKNQSQTNRNQAATNSQNNATMADDDEYQFNKIKIQQNQALRDQAAQKLTPIQDDFKKMQQQIAASGGMANAPEYMLKEADKLREKANGIQNEINGYDAEIKKYTDANKVISDRIASANAAAGQQAAFKEAQAEKANRVASDADQFEIYRDAADKKNEGIDRAVKEVNARSKMATSKADKAERQATADEKHTAEAGIKALERQQKNTAEAKATAASNKSNFKEEQAEKADRFYREEDRRIDSASKQRQLEREQKERLQKEKEGREAAAKAAKEAWEDATETVETVDENGVKKKETRTLKKGGKTLKEEAAQAERDARNPFLELTKHNVGPEETDVYNAYDTLLKLTDRYGDTKDILDRGDADGIAANRAMKIVQEYSAKYPERVASLKSRKQLDEEAKEANPPKKSIGDFFKDLFKIKHDGLEEDGAALIAAVLEPAPVEHHGIEGQKWGNRRFQNEDGSLTPEGYMRYYGKRRKVTERRRNSSANTVKRATAGVAAAAGIAALANRTHQLTKWRKDDRAFNRAANRLARAGYAPAAGHAPFQFDEKSLWKTVGAVAGTAAVVAGGSMIAKALKTKAAKREEEKARYDAYDRIQYERYKEELKQQGFGGSQGGTLAHWGIKEQKWGVRRFRNYDGTLTEAGKERYYSGRADIDIHYLSNEELKAFTDRNNAEAAYKESLARNGKKAFHMSDKIVNASDKVKKVAANTVGFATSALVGSALVYNLVERWKGKHTPGYEPKTAWWAVKEAAKEASKK